MHRFGPAASLLCSLTLLPSCGTTPQTVNAREGRQAAAFGRPTVFALTEGEHRMVLGRRPLFIKIDSATVGSRTLMAGYEEIPPGDSVRVHHHLAEDELVFVHRGEVDVTLNNASKRATAGTTVFIPRGTWIGLRTVGRDTAGFFFAFNAPGFEKCLRLLAPAPGERFSPLVGDALRQATASCHWELRSP